MHSKTDVATMRRVIDEIRASFAELRGVADALAREWHVTAAMRAVLEYLRSNGPATVPQIARAKHHRRQSIQEIVDTLQERCLVFLRDNPAHGRSRLVAISAQGRDVLCAIFEREDALLETIAADCGETAVPLTAMLHNLREAIRRRAGRELEVQE